MSIDSHAHIADEPLPSAAQCGAPHRVPNFSGPVHDRHSGWERVTPLLQSRPGTGGRWWLSGRRHVAEQLLELAGGGLQDDALVARGHLLLQARVPLYYHLLQPARRGAGRRSASSINPVVPFQQQPSSWRQTRNQLRPCLHHHTALLRALEGTHPAKSWQRMATVSMKRQLSFHAARAAATCDGALVAHSQPTCSTQGLPLAKHAAAGDARGKRRRVNARAPHLLAQPRRGGSCAPGACKPGPSSPPPAYCSRIGRRIVNHTETARESDTQKFPVFRSRCRKTQRDGPSHSICSIISTQSQCFAFSFDVADG